MGKPKAGSGKYSGNPPTGCIYHRVVTKPQERAASKDATSKEAASNEEASKEATSKEKASKVEPKSGET